MKKGNKIKKTVLMKMLEDKRALAKCIRECGNIEKIADERNIKLTMPL